MAGLTVKQEKFVQGLFSGLSQREAYKQAYNCKNMSDNAIDREACVLAANPKISQRLGELINELKNNNMVTVQKVVDELAAIAFDDIKNYLRFYTDEKGQIQVEVKDSNTIDTKNIAEVQLSNTTGFKFKLYCKDNALAKLGQHLGMFKDNLNITGELGVKIVDDIK